jgi:actin-like ATPase involved in cell morphogenesis
MVRECSLKTAAREDGVGPSGWVLAVDFGTTNTAAAVRSPSGNVEVVRLSPQGHQMPSCVFDDDGRLVVGDVAANEASTAPQRFERSPKSRLGEPSILLGEREWPTAELVAAVLRHVLDRTMRVTGGRMPELAVLTHPDGWADQRCGRLREAAALAGLPAVKMLPEPVAAAAWYLRRSELGPDAPIAVFDFGGGTCDVAVLRPDVAAPGSFVIEASSGEDELGGDHIDERLMAWVFDQLRLNGHAAIVDSLEDPDPEWELALRDQVRGSKHALSEYRSARIRVRSANESTTVLITAEEFDRLITADVDRAIALTERVLNDARPRTGNITALFCTGGSTHIPYVHRRLTDLLGGPPATLDDPKLVVAQGAALTAPAAGGTAEDSADDADPGVDGRTGPDDDDDRPDVPTTGSRRRLRWAVALIVAVLVTGVLVLVLTPGPGLTRGLPSPSDVEAAPEFNGDVALTWRPASGADQYEVYRDDQMLGTTDETSYVDREAGTGSEYRYSVVAVAGDERSAGASAAPLVTPVAPPDSLKATPEGTDVLVEWEPVAGAERYELARNGQVLTDDLTVQSYRDEDVPLGDHSYEVTAVDEDSDGNTASKSVGVFAQGRWQEAYRIAQRFPGLVSEEPGGRSAAGSVCRSVVPNPQTTVDVMVACLHDNGIRVEVWQFENAERRDTRLSEIAQLSSQPTTSWGYDADGPPQGDFYWGPSGDPRWLVVTFTSGESGNRVLFCVYAEWPNHTAQELYDAWVVDFPWR